MAPVTLWARGLRTSTYTTGDVETAIQQYVQDAIDRGVLVSILTTQVEGQEPVQMSMSYKVVSVTIDHRMQLGI